MTPTERAREVAERIEEEWSPDWTGTGDHRTGNANRRDGLKFATDLILSYRKEVLDAAIRIAGHQEWQENTVVDANPLHEARSLYQRGAEIAGRIKRELLTLRLQDES
jgi:hypothetical protein